VGTVLFFAIEPELYCFHSISFPSEWGQKNALLVVGFGKVSIQLVSPASGDFYEVVGLLILLTRFHSISFPSEWGLQRTCSGRKPEQGFHSISFPSEWGLQGAGIEVNPILGFPFN